MLSRLVCRRNSGANGSRKVASSGKGSGEAFGTRFLFMFLFYHKTNKVVLEQELYRVLYILQYGEGGLDPEKWRKSTPLKSSSYASGHWNTSLLLYGHE